MKKLDLMECRNKLDVIDKEIVRLFEERMSVCGDVAEYKIATGKAVYDAEREKQKSVFEAEMKQISGDDPTVKSVEDLKEKPYFAELYEKVKAGYSLYDAYRLVTYEDHDKRTAEKARRQAMSSAAGKSHLRPAQSRGGELSSPPSDVLAEYRIFFPGASDAEIARLWAKDKKNRNDL